VHGFPFSEKLLSRRDRIFVVALQSCTRNADLQSALLHQFEGELARTRRFPFAAPLPNMDFLFSSLHWLCFALLLPKLRVRGKKHRNGA
jgi:hypothetical protein